MNYSLLLFELQNINKKKKKNKTKNQQKLNAECVAEKSKTLITKQQVQQRKTVN